MSQRVRLVALGAFACLIAGFGGLWYGTFQEAGKSGLTPVASYAGYVRPPGASVPAFSLIDQDGAPFGPASLKGHPAIYAFVYSHCRDTCPLEIQQIRGAMDVLGHDVRVLAVSVDPANDTRSSARRFLAEQHVTGRVDFLLGTREELAPLWRAFGIAPQRDGSEHTASIVLVDGKGRQRLGYPASRLTVHGLLHDLRSLRV